MRGETRGRTRPYLEAEGNRIAGRGRAARAPLGSAQTGSETCKRYKRFAVSGWEHNRVSGESKLQEMKSDPAARRMTGPVIPTLRG